MHMHSLFHIILLLYVQYLIRNKGPGWLNELGSWIIKQLIQAYHQNDVGSRTAL